MTLYEELEVEKTATPNEIKKAYRKKSKKVHPDHNPDDPEAAEKFGALTRAYDILMDEEKRKRYDAGEDPEKMGEMKTPRDMAVHAVIGLFHSVLDQVDTNSTNVFMVMREAIGGSILNFKKEIRKIDRQIDKLQAVAKRISHKKKSHENIFIQSIEAQIRGIEGDKKQVEDQVKIADISLEIVSDYEYRVDKFNPFNPAFQASKTTIRGGF